MTAELTREERALIDAAIAAGMTRKIETGASGFPPMKWCPKRKQLHEYELHEAPKMKNVFGTPLHVKAAIADAEKRRKKVAQLMNEGVPPKDITAWLGIPKSTLTADLQKLRARGLVKRLVRTPEEIDALCRPVWVPGMGARVLRRLTGLSFDAANNWIKRQQA